VMELVHSADDSVEKNDYELLRESKIARNQKRLAELGLLKLNPLCGSENRAAKPIKRKTPGVTLLSQPALLRRSQRRCVVEATSQAEHEKEENCETTNLPTALPGKRRNHTSTAIKQPSLKQKPIIQLNGKTSTRFIQINSKALISANLGRQQEQYGKEVVVNQSSKYSLSHNCNTGGDNNITISFNKYSGILEWQNALFLWVNLNYGCKIMNRTGSKQGTIVNEFSENGQFITWFGGSKMSEDTPVIKRLIEVGSNKNAAATAENQDAIILWVRYDSSSNGSSFSPYVCLGRCGYKSHISGSQPVKFTLSLLDYEDLKLLMNKEDCRSSILKRILLHGGDSSPAD